MTPLSSMYSMYSVAKLNVYNIQGGGKLKTSSTLMGSFCSSFPPPPQSTGQVQPVHCSRRWVSNSTSKHSISSFSKLFT